MGKLRVLSGRDACKILEKHGFHEVKRRGDGPGSRSPELAIGTLLSIIRHSGIARTEFES